MTKDDLRRRDEAINAFLQDFGRDYFETVALVDRLIGLGRRARRNAENLCNIPDAPDLRDSICKAVARVLRAAELDVPFTVGGDPRGYCLKIILPSRRYNTMGGAEEGWGF